LRLPRPRSVQRASANGSIQASATSATALGAKSTPWWLQTRVAQPIASAMNGA
jgi:hypothetical protein